MPYYVVDEHGQKAEAYTKEQVLSILEQAIEDGSLEEITEDSGFITKIKCCVGSQTHKIAFVTEAQYNTLAAGGLLEANAYYFITDDTSWQTLQNIVAAIISGATQVGSAAHADSATNATNATNAGKATILGTGNVVFEWDGTNLVYSVEIQSKGLYLVEFGSSQQSTSGIRLTSIILIPRTDVYAIGNPFTKVTTQAAHGTFVEAYTPYFSSSEDEISVSCTRSYDGTTTHNYPIYKITKIMDL